MIHSFNTDLAEKYGIEKALLLDHFCYWIAENERNEKNQIDGRTWVYNTSKALAEKFHYMSQRSIARYLEQLEKDGIILTGKFNTNHFDNTKWYALSDEYLYLLNDYKSMREIKASNNKNITNETKNCENIDIAENENSISQNEIIDVAKSCNSISQNGNSDLPKWQVNKNIQTYTKKENSFSNENELKKNPQNAKNEITKIENLPNEIDRDIFEKFLFFQATEKNNRLSVMQCEALILKLMGWLQNENIDPNECLLQSISNGYKGVFKVEPKIQKANSEKSLSQRLAEQEARILAKYEKQQSEKQTQMLENSEAIDCEILGA